MNHTSGAPVSQQNQKAGGSDKYFYEDFKNGYTESIMSAKLNGYFLIFLPKLNETRARFHNKTANK